MSLKWDEWNYGNVNITEQSMLALQITCASTQWASPSVVTHWTKVVITYPFLTRTLRSELCVVIVSLQLSVQSGLDSNAPHVFENKKGNRIVIADEYWEIVHVTYFHWCEPFRRIKQMIQNVHFIILCLTKNYQQ